MQSCTYERQAKVKPALFGTVTRAQQAAQSRAQPSPLVVPVAVLQHPEGGSAHPKTTELVY